MAPARPAHRIILFHGQEEVFKDFPLPNVWLHDAQNARRSLA